AFAGQYRHVGCAIVLRPVPRNIRVQSTLAAASFDEGLRLLCVKVAQSDARYDHRRIALGPHKSKLDDAREHVGGSDLWRLIQCGQRHRVPEPALNAFGLAQTVEPLSYGDFSKPIPIAVQRPDRQPDAQSAQTVPPTDGLQPRQSAEQVQRRWQRRTFEARVDYGAVGLFVKEINPRISLEFEFVERTDFFQKP